MVTSISLRGIYRAFGSAARAPRRGPPMKTGKDPA
jgi:hypothetical protein